MHSHAGLAQARRLAAALVVALALGACGQVDASGPALDSQADFAPVDAWLDAGLAPSSETAGLSVALHRNGARAAEGRWIEGRKEGPWRVWRDDGSLRWEGEYLGNELHGPERGWHANGQLEFEGERRHGRRHGRLRTWHESGRLACEAEYSDGKLHGVCRRFNVDGEPDAKASGRYENGVKRAEL
jgi:hypothetical protein